MQLLETQSIAINLVSGLAFFTLGLVAALQIRRQSRLALARSLPLLAAFGVLQAFAEWGYYFIPEQAEEVTAAAGPIVAGPLLWLAHALLAALAFAVMYQFGVGLVLPSTRFRLIRLLPAASFFVCLGAYLWIATRHDFGSDPGHGVAMIASGETLARYLLALPGALFASAGLARQASAVEGMGFGRIARYHRLAALALLAFAVLAGLIVPRTDLFPASVVSSEHLERLTGIPSPVFMSAAGLAIAYFVVRALEVFDADMDREFHALRRDQVLARERERIARDLHDGSNQSIYSVGLALEDVILTIDEDPELARRKTREAMASLDGVIVDIRQYIHDLSRDMGNVEFEADLSSLAQSYARQLGIAVDVKVVPSWRRPLGPGQAAHLLHVAREALANVAQHANASRLRVVLRYEREAAVLKVEDNGRGFRTGRPVGAGELGRRNGLRNIAQRVELLGGQLRIESAPGRGTKVVTEVPYAPVESGPDRGQTTSAA